MRYPAVPGVPYVRKCIQVVGKYNINNKYKKCLTKLGFAFNALRT
jgi:hypothetical protein